MDTFEDEEAAQLAAAIELSLASLALEDTLAAARKEQQQRQDADYAIALNLAQQFEEEAMRHILDIQEQALREAQQPVPDPPSPPSPPPPAQPPPALANLDVVQLLPTSTYAAGRSTGESAVCAVCQCDYEEGDRLMHLPCLHAFHEDCVSDWLRKNKKCPMCKMLLWEAISSSVASSRGSSSSGGGGGGGSRSSASHSYSSSSYHSSGSLSPA